MKASKLIEELRKYEDCDVVIDVGFNIYEIDNNISYERENRLIVIELLGEHVNNELLSK